MAPAYVNLERVERQRATRSSAGKEQIWWPVLFFMRPSLVVECPTQAHRRGWVDFSFQAPSKILAFRWSIRGEAAPWAGLPGFGTLQDIRHYCIVLYTLSAIPNFHPSKWDACHTCRVRAPVWPGTFLHKNIIIIMAYLSLLSPIFIPESGIHVTRVLW
jgi:hypothetical protein